jgi:hypothetical protein
MRKAEGKEPGPKPRGPASLAQGRAAEAALKRTARSALVVEERRAMVLSQPMAMPRAAMAAMAAVMPMRPASLVVRGGQTGRERMRKVMEAETPRAAPAREVLTMRAVRRVREAMVQKSLAMGDWSRRMA